jgi:type II secretory pathway predicted ATPase ExeA
MNWITPGIETNVAYAAGMVLFGLLILSVRNRKMATRIPYTFYASPARSTVRQTPIHRSTKISRRVATPLHQSGLLLSTGLEHRPREKASTKAPEIFVNPLPAPLDFPLPQISDEVKMNSAPYPFENLDPVALAEISAFAVQATASTIHEHISTSLAAYGLAEIEERIAQEIAIATEALAAQESVSETLTAVEAGGADQSGTAEAAPESQTPPVEAASETSATTDVLSFYGMPQQPFDVTPDPAYLYLTPSHREALTSLKEGIEHFRGFMVLVAEPGMGKTTLLNKLMEQLTDSARVVFLFQTQCSSRELLCFILNELEVDHTGMDVVAMHRALNQALLEEMLRGRRFVLVVDEAQNLQEPVLETIRLLSDFETTHSKLIQIVLAGQPQLADSLMKPSLVQLRQRIAVLSSLKALTPTETAAYIEHRLRAAGWRDKMIFSSDALDQIAESSGGVPRRINNLCFNALLEGFHRGVEVVEQDLVKEVAERLNVDALVRRPKLDREAQQTAAQAETIASSQLARALAAALKAEPEPEVSADPLIGPKRKPEVVLTGNLTEKVRSQGWSKNHEYRILVSLERDVVSGLPIADRYYCCSIYVDDAQAAGLRPGKPVRIKIEQD